MEEVAPVAQIMEFYLLMVYIKYRLDIIGLNNAITIRTIYSTMGELLDTKVYHHSEFKDTKPFPVMDFEKFKQKGGKWKK